MKTILMKFGGSSIGITPGMTQLLSIVLNENERWDQVVLIVSALDGVTDRLIEASQFALLSNSRGYRRIVGTLRHRHLALINDLPFSTSDRAALQTDIDRVLFDMHDACQKLGNVADKPAQVSGAHPLIDRIIGTGERLTARIIAALLRASGLRSVAIDGTDILVTDDQFGSANPIMPLTQTRIDEHLRPLLQRGIIPVITGFIGATTGGIPTTLGRGGSDYSASAIAVCIGASEMWVYSDVDGIMSADPNAIAHAQVVPMLNYDEAAELAFYGARVLHTRMIAPLADSRIPVRVKNIFNPQGGGTLIDERPVTPGAKAVTVIDGLALTAPSTIALTEMIAFVEGQFRLATGARIEAVISAQSAARTFACFVIPTHAGPDALHMLQTVLTPALTGFSGAWTAQPVGVITLVGGEIGSAWRELAALITLMSDLSPLGVIRNPSNHSISMIFTPEQVEKATRSLHEYIVGA